MISNQGDFINRVVREFRNDVALRSGQRKVNLTPDLVSGIYEYACPIDLADHRIIDIPAQAKRYDGSFGIVPVEQFNRYPQDGDIAFGNANGARTLFIKSQVPSTTITLDNTSAVTGWTAVGDATNIELDSSDYISANSSIKFEISSAGNTTAGIEKATIDALDMTDYFDNSWSVFVWHKINSVTGITNYIFRIGNNSSNYYSKTITTRSDGTAFQVGWNLLRFDLSNMTEVGTVDKTNTDYIACYMTKLGSKIDEFNYKFNNFVLKKGVIHNILYYSKYGWQTSAGAYIQNSTDALDVVVADDTEYDLIVRKGIVLGMPLTNFDINERTEAKRDYETAKVLYQSENPDESNLMVSNYQLQ